MMESSLAELTPREQIGGNLPPTPYDEIKARVDSLVATANKWATERPVLLDKAMATLCDGYLTQVEKELKAAEDARTTEKAPFLAGGSAVDAKWNPVKSLLATIKTVLKPRYDKFLAEEQKRLDDQRAQAAAEAQRLADAAELAKKAAETGTGTVIENIVAAEQLAEQAKEAVKAVTAIPTRAAVKSDVSSRARSLRKTWHARVDNVSACFTHYRTHPEVKAVLEKLAGADARGGVRKIPGCTIYPTQGS